MQPVTISWIGAIIGLAIAIMIVATILYGFILK